MEAMAALTGLTMLFITGAAIIFLIRSVFVPGARGLMLKRALLSIFFVFILMMAGNYFASERDQQFRAAAETGGFDSIEEYIASRKFHVNTKTEYAKAKAEQEANLKAYEEQKAQQKFYEERKKAESELKLEEQKQSKLKVQAEWKQAELKEAEKKELACTTDLQCLGDKLQIRAAFACKNPVERLAKFQAEWTDGLLEPKFSHFRWRNKKTGIVTYIGDKVKFQNGFGAWQHMVYECDYDSKRDVVRDVRAHTGRL